VKNRIVGVLVVIIALLMGFIIFSFNSAFTDVINSACSHGAVCPMWETLDFQTNVSIAIMAFVIVIGLYLIFFGKEEKIITKIIKMVEKKEPKAITKESYSKVLSGLSSEEKVIVEKLIESKGSLSQSNLIEHTDFNKVRISRILDRLEGRGVVERKRHGMSNIVVLK
jgi:uncharacterized membrane protein